LLVINDSEESSFNFFGKIDDDFPLKPKVQKFDWNKKLFRKTFNLDLKNLEDHEKEEIKPSREKPIMGDRNNKKLSF
jgi:hypothetical protein